MAIIVRLAVAAMLASTCVGFRNLQRSGTNASCGSYCGATTYNIPGNGGVTYTVVKVLSNQLTVPSYYNDSPYSRDNTMTLATAYQFDAMYRASGGIIKISSAFRTLQRQQYFWDAYCCSRASGYTVCSCGPLAAVPGTSNHGVGIALDVNTNCGGGGTISSPPSACWSSAVYVWLANNAASYGFQRTVNSEPWHWEYRGGGGGGTGEGAICEGDRGLCIDTTKSNCPRSTLSGLCPGGSNIRCCPSSAPGVGSPCSSTTGVCIDTSATACPRATLGGQCPGGASIRCCPYDTSASGSGSSCDAGWVLNGTCINTGRDSCHTATLTGKCPGSSAIQCCPRFPPA